MNARKYQTVVSFIVSLERDEHQRDSHDLVKYQRDSHERVKYQTDVACDVVHLTGDLHSLPMNA